MIILRFILTVFCVWVGLNYVNDMVISETDRDNHRVALTLFNFMFAILFTTVLSLWV